MHLAPPAGVSEEQPWTESRTVQDTMVLKSLDSIYDSMLGAEQREAHPDDQIYVGLSPNNIEYEMLQTAGVSAEMLQQGVLSRKELIDSGFRFINTLGGGEKGIISGTVVDPDDGKSVDFTDRKLLTHEELNMVYRYQQSRPEIFGLQGQDIDEVRRDMLSFVMEASTEQLFGSEGHMIVEILRDDRFQYGQSEDGYTIEDWGVVKQYIAKRAETFMSANGDSKLELHAALRMAQEELIRSQCADMYELIEVDRGPFNSKNVRGNPTMSLGMMRGGSLSGQASPFLESGFTFGRNLDVNVFGGDPDMRSKDQRRINMATIHLAGAHPDYPGFSEMGGMSADQKYMPTGYYVKNIFPEDSEEREDVHVQEASYVQSSHKRDIIFGAQARLIEAVRAINDSEAPVDAIGFQGLVSKSTWDKIRESVAGPSNKRKESIEQAKLARQKASEDHHGRMQQ